MDDQTRDAEPRPPYTEDELRRVAAAAVVADSAELSEDDQNGTGERTSS